MSFETKILVEGVTNGVDEYRELVSVCRSLWYVE